MLHNILHSKLKIEKQDIMPNNILHSKLKIEKHELHLNILQGQISQNNPPLINKMLKKTYILA